MPIKLLHSRYRLAFILLFIATTLPGVSDNRHIRCNGVGLGDTREAIHKLWGKPETEYQEKVTYRDPRSGLPFSVYFTDTRLNI